MSHVPVEVERNLSIVMAKGNNMLADGTVRETNSTSQDPI